MSDRESYLIRLSDQIVPLAWQEPPVEMSEAERVFICIWQLEAEVNNGGFTQYFTNSSGDPCSMRKFRHTKGRFALLSAACCPTRRYSFSATARSNRAMVPFGVELRRFDRATEALWLAVERPIR
jgi:hypothetical protein